MGAFIYGFTLLDSRFEDVGESLGGLRGDVSEMTYSLREIRSSIGSLELQTEGMISTRDFNAWVRLLRAQNPGIEIPEAIE